MITGWAAIGIGSLIEPVTGETEIETAMTGGGQTGIVVIAIGPATESETETEMGTSVAMDVTETATETATPTVLETQTAIPGPRLLLNPLLLPRQANP
jgi:hypothetical protein